MLEVLIILFIAFALFLVYGRCVILYIVKQSLCFFFLGKNMNPVMNIKKMDSIEFVENQTKHQCVGFGGNKYREKLGNNIQQQDILLLFLLIYK